MFINIGCNQRLLQVTFWNLGLLAYCKMAAPILIMCAHWPLYLPPLSKNKQWQIGGQEKKKKKPNDLTS